jgi:hypothetical protein
VFRGEICGIGTASGHRIVVGRWPCSPFGPVADVMCEGPDGWRTLRAPSAELAGFIAATYTFDEVRVEPVHVRRSANALEVEAGRLRVAVSLGGRDPLGWVLRAVPRRLAARPAWAALVDLPARLLLAGVRTRGQVGDDRREWYGVLDAHRVRQASARLDGMDLGGLADVWPPVRFGFASTPSRPRIVAVTTTIEVRTPVAGGPGSRVAVTRGPLARGD